ncbi:MAG TPA: ferritin-like domain-containing protein [Solirubrobacteraceae bacterium]|jgi:rubrerythrin|nr:ferritin-like domain-containing protein [Solirubrobacteraceae bacterium]
MTQHATQQESEHPPPGIVQRLVEDDVDRKRFLKALGGAGAAGFGAFALAACGSASKSSTASTGAATGASQASASRSSDIGILNYALTLEYLETQFYEKVNAAGLFSGKVGSLIKEFGAQEQTHVEALKGAVAKLGGTPAMKPEGRFPIKSATQVAELAYTVENLGAAAYLGQAAKIQSPEVLAAALAIHSVEARHAATLGTLVKKSLTPDGAFAKPADMSTVRAAVKPFLA